jgi:membrane fusion protein
VNNSVDKVPAVALRDSLPAKVQPLFRQQVLVEHQSQWLGTVLLEPRITQHVFAAFAVVAAAAVVALFFFTSYTRKARVNGWLVPQQGVARIVAPQAGVVTHIHVREGMQVSKGMPLIVLSTEVQSEVLGATRQEIVQRLVKRRNSMAEERATQERLFEQQTTDLHQRLDALRQEQQHLAREVALQLARLQLTETVVARLRPMRARDIIPAPRLEEAEAERIDQSGRLQTLERAQASLRREMVQVNGALREIPLRRKAQLADIERNVAALEQELAEAELRRQIIVPAPQDGTVTGLQIEPGGTAQPTVPLMSIVPVGATLQAQLFSPSHAIGFLEPGQRVFLRYAAFPFQKFGSYEGVVASVSRSAVSPSELPQQLTGLTALYGSSEPVYRVTVDLGRQTVTAYGQQMPLQPGMQLEADVLIESRRLIEWVLDPLFTLTGKWH